MAKLYNSFRMNMSKRLGGGAGFFALTEMRLFSGENGAGNQLLTGGTAAASSNYDASADYLASNAFDGNISTRWATASVSSAWIRYDLPSAVPKPKSIYLLLNNSPNNAPTDFVLQASVDNGATWEDIYAVISFATSAEFLSGVTRSLAQIGLLGKATISNGAIANRVLIYDWLTAALLQELTPDSLGNWRYLVAANTAPTNYLVVVTAGKGVFNVRPQAHGPVTAKPLE